MPSFLDADENLKGAESELQSNRVTTALSLAQNAIEVSLKALMQSYNIEYRGERCPSCNRPVGGHLTSSEAISQLLDKVGEKSSTGQLLEAKKRVAQAAILCNMLAQVRDPTRYGSPEGTPSEFSGHQLFDSQSTKDLATAFLNLCHELIGSCHFLALQSRETGITF